MKQKFIYSEQYHDYLRLLGEAGGAYVISEPDVTITNEDEFSIYKYEVRFEGDRDLVTPFELQEINY